MRGFLDSFRGMVTLLYLDKELNKRKLERLSPSRNTPIRRKQSDTKEDTTAPTRSLKKHE